MTHAVDAEVVLVADRRGGRTRLVTSRSAFPISIRRTGSNRVHLVGSGAWPLGGDRVRLVIDVGVGADLEVAAVAANVALPGRSGDPSVAQVEVRVARGARLRLDLGPTIVAHGADHRSVLDVELDAGAALALRELVVLGRENEGGGRSEQRLDVTCDGSAVVRELAVRPNSEAPTFGDGGARAVGSVLLVDGHPDRGACEVAGDGPDAAVRGAVLSLAGGVGWRAVAVGDGVAEVGHWLDRPWAAAGEALGPTGR